MVKTSEMVRRLEDTIESLRRDNQELRSKVGTIAEETIQDLQKKIAELSRELKARVKQVEDLQSSYKTLQEENKRLKSKLEQMVDEYDEEYQENTKRSPGNDYNRRLNQQIKKAWEEGLNDMFGNVGFWK